MRLDSLPALRSVLDYVSNGSSDFVLRKYISNARHLRIIVIGSEVKDVIEYKSQSGDFRTNAVATPQVEVVKDLPGDIAASAVSSVHELGLEFGGIDVLVDENGDYHIAEVNFPCNFARNQANTGADIAGMIIDYLLKKRSLID
jgi:glutathione synthase/RimK-type ligase-like ATP-grasp enzyme